MARGRAVAAGGCVGTRDGDGSCGKLSRSAGQSHGKVTLTLKIIYYIGVKCYSHELCLLMQNTAEAMGVINLMFVLSCNYLCDVSILYVYFFPSVFQFQCRGQFSCRYWLPFISLTLSDLGTTYTDTIVL